MTSSAEYMRKWRAARPEKHQRQRALSDARSRAMTKLAERHAAEFRRLYNAECDAAGIARPRPPGRPLKQVAS